jgi:aldose 1-epimerase
VESNPIEQSPALKYKEDMAGKIKLYTIENRNGLQLTVSNYGAAVVSLFVKNKKGILEDIVLGYSKPSDYITDEFYLGTVVGRCANRIGGGRININDKAHRLSLNRNGFHHHGGFEGFNKKLFQAEPFQRDSESGVLFKYVSPHLEEGYPGELTLLVRYTLNENDQWKIDYEARTTEDTIVNFTQHSYFNLSGDASNSIEEHEIRINSNYYLPVNQSQLPTGELAPVSGTPFDFRQSKQIGRDIEIDDVQLNLSKGYDHSFVLDSNNNGSTTLAAVVSEKNSGRKMEIYTTEPVVHFYTGNFLHHVKGKLGVVYNQRSGFCLETQHYPDSPNHNHFPSMLLEAGMTFQSQTIFSFSIL